MKHSIWQRRKKIKQFPLKSYSKNIPYFVGMGGGRSDYWLSLFAKISLFNIYSRMVTFQLWIIKFTFHKSYFTSALASCLAWFASLQFLSISQLASSSIQAWISSDENSLSKYVKNGGNSSNSRRAKNFLWAVCWRFLDTNIQ